MAPPAPYLTQVKASAAAGIAVAAQNCSKEVKGAFTGEVSPAMVVDLGLPWVILGHSERRSIFGESSALIADKVKAALAAGLGVVLCCGEQLAERQAGKTLAVVQDQLKPVIAAVTAEQWAKIVIA